jgi:hypothetical protein
VVLVIRVTEFRIDGGHSNAHAVWEELGCLLTGLIMDRLLLCRPTSHSRCYKSLARCLS